MSQQKVIIIDYGSQLTQLIARRVREAGVYSEIHSCQTSAEELKGYKPSALILSGGPANAGEEGAPRLDPGYLELGVPILGICYGMQLLALHFGGELERASSREYGPADLDLCAPSPLWTDIPANVPTPVWMSHGDTVKSLPENFTVIGKTSSIAIAAMADEEKRIYGLQFHPEVHHTVAGTQMIANFLFRIAGLSPDWNMASFVERSIGEIREKVGRGNVVCALSGGIDSTVVAVLLHKAIGRQLYCIFVDNGLLRMDEANQVTSTLKEYFDLQLIRVDAADLFLKRIAGVADPEEKRKIIGHTFIEIFDEQARKIPDALFLAQGTLYPDVIESVSAKGPSAVIKSHHNVGGLPERMKLKLIEPLRELFKDEVRTLAQELGIPDTIVWRQPFPGPGLAIRVLGEVTEKRLEILRKADLIVQQELGISGWQRKIWQGFAVLLPLRTVGVMGDSRTYENVVALRCVDSIDAMTADWTRLPWDILAGISSRIINEVQGVNRVVYDISSKPPSTIEWE